VDHPHNGGGKIVGNVVVGAGEEEVPAGLHHDVRGPLHHVDEHSPGRIERPDLLLPLRAAGVDQTRHQVEGSVSMAARAIMHGPLVLAPGTLEEERLGEVLVEVVGHCADAVACNERRHADGLARDLVGNGGGPAHIPEE